MQTRPWSIPDWYRHNWTAPKYRAIQAERRHRGKADSKAMLTLGKLRGAILRDIRELQREIQQLELEALLSRPA